MGRIVRVTGPVVIAEGMTGVEMYEVVRVGEQGLIGEVIGLKGTDRAVIQVYEETVGLKPGEKVTPTGGPLSAELGPGLIGSIYDGIQRPLTEIRERVGEFVRRGIYPNPLSREKRWEFIPTKKKGEEVRGGDVLGIVRETELVEHRILVPPNVVGELVEINEGRFTVEEPIGEVRGEKKYELKLMQTWPVRKPRPYRRKLIPTEPLITGQRVTDFLFPVAKGGTGAIPGGFGTGKTVFLHQAAKWSDAHIVVYVGCGERGNEMCDVLVHFPKLKDPKTGRPLMERTVLVANTSNMPVAAREASIYLGTTIGEYFRDMGYHVSLMADSTSRWAEAMREISGRLEEMPGEEGFPAYLASRLAEFYERAGTVETLNGQIGSLTILGAVSPPGGDFSEPVTQNTLRIVKVFWGLDSSLADRRHFPSVNWLTSYSLYTDVLANWWNRFGDWQGLRAQAMAILQKEAELLEIVRLVGPDALPEPDKLILEVARMIREDFLQQSAFDPVDTYCPPQKQFKLIEIILHFYRLAHLNVQRGVPVSKIKSLPVVQKIAQLKRMPLEEFEEEVEKLRREMEDLAREV